MRHAILVAALLALLADSASAETLEGQFLFHSKDSKVVGIKSPAGLVALADGQQIQVKGLPAIDGFKACDVVTIEFSRQGRQRVLDAISLKQKATNSACEKPLQPLPLAEFTRAVADQSATILDVRSAAEFAQAHISGAINLPVTELDSRFAELPKDKPIIIYCHSGRRAGFASWLLQEKGIGSAYVKGKFVVTGGKPQITE